MRFPYAQAGRLTLELSGYPPASDNLKEPAQLMMRGKQTGSPLRWLAGRAWLIQAAPW